MNTKTQIYTNSNNIKQHQVNRDSTGQHKTQQLRLILVRLRRRHADDLQQEM